MSNEATNSEFEMRDSGAVKSPLATSSSNVDDQSVETEPPRTTIQVTGERHGKSALHDLVKPEFYHQDNWFEEMCDILFKLKRRNTTVKAEIYYGIIHFISCLYCLAVVVSVYESPFPCSIIINLLLVFLYSFSY